MTHDNGHTTQLVKGSTKREKLPGTGTVYGLRYTIRCCPDAKEEHRHEKSFHIQNPGRYSTEELHRVLQDHHVQVADEHHDDVTALKFLEEHEANQGDCGCE